MDENCHWRSRRFLAESHSELVVPEIRRRISRSDADFTPQLWSDLLELYRVHGGKYPTREAVKVVEGLRPAHAHVATAVLTRAFMALYVDLTIAELVSIGGIYPIAQHRVRSYGQLDAAQGLRKGSSDCSQAADSISKGAKPLLPFNVGCHPTRIATSSVEFALFVF